MIDHERRTLKWKTDHMTYWECSVVSVVYSVSLVVYSRARHSFLLVLTRAHFLNFFQWGWVSLLTCMSDVHFSVGHVCFSANFPTDQSLGWRVQVWSWEDVHKLQAHARAHTFYKIYSFQAGWPHIPWICHSSGTASLYVLSVMPSPSCRSRPRR